MTARTWLRVSPPATAAHAFGLPDAAASEAIAATTTPATAISRRGSHR